MKLIKINTDHYIIVDDSEIKIGDWYYDTDDNESLMPIYQRSQDPKFYSGCKKITHSTQPFEEGATIHGVEHKRWVYIKYIDLLEVKELIGEVDVEKKMISPYSVNTQNNVDWCNGYQRGYNQALEDNKEKKWTDADVIRIVEKSRQTGLTAEYLMLSLQPKTEWDVKFINGKLKLM